MIISQIYNPIIIQLFSYSAHMQLHSIDHTKPRSEKNLFQKLLFVAKVVPLYLLLCVIYQDILILYGT